MIEAASVRVVASGQSEPEDRAKQISITEDVNSSPQTVTQPVKDEPDMSLLFDVSDDGMLTLLED